MEPGLICYECVGTHPGCGLTDFDSRWYWGKICPRSDDRCVKVGKEQACKLKFRLIELTSSLSSAAVSAVCFEGHVAGLDATETGYELPQPKFEFTSLEMNHTFRQKTFF